jgi:ABC-2 type transport system permease protein
MTPILLASFTDVAWRILLASPAVLWPLVVIGICLLLSPRIRAVFKREFFSYFNSPVAYVIIVIFLLATQSFTFFFGGFLDGDDANLAQPFFSWHPWIYMVLVPAVGMKLWSEEYRLGTLELLMTMPISPWHGIVGKFFAASTVWFIALFLTFPIVITVFYLGSPDLGPIVSAFNGSFLYAVACLAVTCAVSAFTRSQVVCFIISVAICLVLTLLGAPRSIEVIVKALPSSLEGTVHFIAYFCFLTHFYDMSKGVLLLRDLLYFVSVTVLCLMITGWALQSKRS